MLPLNMPLWHKGYLGLRAVDRKQMQEGLPALPIFSEKQSINFQGCPSTHPYQEALRPLKVKVKVTQLCPTLCDPMNYTVHGILQARILEWVVFPCSRGPYQPRDQTQVSHIVGGFFTV